MLLNGEEEILQVELWATRANNNHVEYSLAS